MYNNALSFSISFLNHMDMRYSRTSLIAQLVKNLPARPETPEVLQKKEKENKNHNHRPEPDKESRGRYISGP